MKMNGNVLEQMPFVVAVFVVDSSFDLSNGFVMSCDAWK